MLGDMNLEYLARGTEIIPIVEHFFEDMWAKSICNRTYYGTLQW